MTALHNWHYQNITPAMPKHQDGSFGQCCKEHVSGAGTSAEGFLMNPFTIHLSCERLISSAMREWYIS